MTIDDPRTYVMCEETPDEAETRLEFAVNIETLQDEMRRIKRELSYDAFARLIPKTVSQYAPTYPDGGVISSQNIYDFLKLESPSIPSPKLRLAYHAFMMVIDELYRAKWNYTHFVKRGGLALTEFFATNRLSNPYEHSVNIQKSAGLYNYLSVEDIAAPLWKEGFVNRCLLLSVTKDMPFLLAYDFDVVKVGEPPAKTPQDYVDKYWNQLQASWDLDARVGYYIPKRSAEEGVLLLNSFKWDWPTIYASIFNYVTKDFIDDTDGEVVDLLLSDVNSFQNVINSEKTYLASDYEVPDNRKIMVRRSTDSAESLNRFSSLLARKFNWGADL